MPAVENEEIEDISHNYYSLCYEDFLWFLEKSEDEYEKISDKIASELQSAKCSSILDVGGGPGLLTRLVFDKCPALLESFVDCVEPQGMAHEAYKTRVPELRNLFPCDWETHLLTGKAEKYDVIISSNSMYGVNLEDETILIPFLEQLNDGGRSIIVLGAEESDFVRTPCRFWQDFYGVPYSKNTAEKLARALDSIGIPFAVDNINASFDIKELEPESLKRFAAFSLYLPSNSEADLRDVIEYLNSIAKDGLLTLSYRMFVLSK